MLGPEGVQGAGSPGLGGQGGPSCRCPEKARTGGARRPAGLWLGTLESSRALPGGGCPQVTPRTGLGNLCLSPAGLRPWHTRQPMAKSEPAGFCAPRGTWPWPPALHPPLHLVLCVFARSGLAAPLPPDTCCTVALPGVQTGGCRPGSGESTGGWGRPAGGWEKGRASRDGAWPVSRGRGPGWELSFQPHCSQPVTHTSPYNTHKTHSAQSSRGSSPHPTPRATQRSS